MSVPFILNLEVRHTGPVYCDIGFLLRSCVIDIRIFSRLYLLSFGEGWECFQCSKLIKYLKCNDFMTMNGRTHLKLHCLVLIKVWYGMYGIPTYLCQNLVRCSLSVENRDQWNGASKSKNIRIPQTSSRYNRAASDACGTRGTRGAEE